VQFVKLSVLRVWISRMLGRISGCIQVICEFSILQKVNYLPAYVAMWDSVAEDFLVTVPLVMPFKPRNLSS